MTQPVAAAQPAGSTTDSSADPRLGAAAQEILDSLVEGVAIFTPELRLSYVNQNARFMLQLATPSYQQRPLGHLFPAHVTTALIEALGRAQRGEAVLTYELISRFPQGTEILLGLAISPVPAPPREPESYVVTCRDLSVSREVVRLNEIARAKEEFFSTVSHELRTPLTSLVAYAEVLELGPAAGEAQVREFAGIMRRESERLSRLIDQVLDLSRMQANRLSLHLQEFDLRAVLRASVEGIAAQAAKAGLALVLEGEGQAVRTMADPERVRQVFTNLLGNAIKFTPAGGRVTAGCAARHHQVEAWVSDTGVGIAPEDLPRIYEQFERIEQPSATVKGTGLGLAIVKGLVERMGGRTWMESEPGKGTRATFTLPRARAAADPAPASPA